MALGVPGGPSYSNLIVISIFIVISIGIVIGISRYKYIVIGPDLTHSEEFEGKPHKELECGYLNAVKFSIFMKIGNK